MCDRGIKTKAQLVPSPSALFSQTPFHSPDNYSPATSPAIGIWSAGIVLKRLANKTVQVFLENHEIG